MIKVLWEERPLFADRTQITEPWRTTASGVATQYAALGFLHEMPPLTLS